MLKYIGNGAFVVGVPGRNLSSKEVRKHGGKNALLRTGLYAEPRKLKKKVKPVKKAKE